jgi:hypothetical protein
MARLKHPFTWLVWEFVNNRAACKKYRKSDPKKPGPVPAGFTAPKPLSPQANALHGNSAKAINLQILNEWGRVAIAPPLVKRHPAPNWPSRP